MNNFDVAGDLQNEKSGMENQHKRIQQAKKKDFHTSSLWTRRCQTSTVLTADWG